MSHRSLLPKAYLAELKICVTMLRQIQLSQQVTMVLSWLSTRKEKYESFLMAHRFGESQTWMKDSSSREELTA